MIVKMRVSDEMLDEIRETRCISTELYNSDGQILIYPKDYISDTDLGRIEKYATRGIYFNKEHQATMTVFADVVPQEDPEPPPEPNLLDPVPPEGLTSQKLLEEKTVKEFSATTNKLLTELKITPLSEMRSSELKGQLNEMFRDFNDQPEAMTGLVNVIDVLGGMDLMPEPEKAIKRTIVSMALKVRGFKATSFQDKQIMEQKVNTLMMSSMLCDVGYLRMTLPEQNGLSKDEMARIRMHPVYSYMLVFHDETIEPDVRFNILSHHSPMMDTTGDNNNYPPVKWVQEQLSKLKERVPDISKQQRIQQDIDMQRLRLSQGVKYNEDVAIMAISSEFASLTTKTEWRDAFSPVEAVKMIINNSFFSYPDRIVRDFLDHISVSLCNNERILKQGDFVVMASYGQGEKIYWEAGVIRDSGRYQSRPHVQLLATVKPIFISNPKFLIRGFEASATKAMPRQIDVYLDREGQRRIVYFIDGKRESELYRILDSLVDDL